MPNHVKTIVRMTGDQESIKKLLESHTKLNQHGLRFDFETIIPMPDNIFRGDLGREEREKYGRNNWYDWSVENWGTKWNAYEFNIIGKGKFVFQTAWSFPDPVIKRLSEIYPNITFHIRYADEDIGSNLGKFTLKNGEEVTLEVNNERRFAYRVWGS